MKKPPHSRTTRRTWFTNLVGVGVILLGGMGSIFSLFALLLAIGKPYANASSDPLGFFLIFILPPSTLLAGFGLLLRQRWARWWMILLMIALIAFGVKGLVAPTHENSAYAPVPGPAADALKRSVIAQSGVCITVGGIVLFGLFSPYVRPPGAAQSWLVGHHGRDLMFYEELHAGNWLRMEIDDEMRPGRAHHVIYFASPEIWFGYPDWARHRRNEIMARIKSRFGEPDYEYQENGTIPRIVPNIPSAPIASPPVDGGRVMPAILTLLVLAIAAFWCGLQGLKAGETRLPAKISGNHRVTLAEKTALFWTSIGLLGMTGTASAVGTLWLVMAGTCNMSQRLSEKREDCSFCGRDEDG